MNKKVLIISDGKPGHLNQSIAFCKIKSLEYDILEVSFKFKVYKLLTYIFDQFNFYSLRIFNYQLIDFFEYDAFVSTGSNTYYFNKSIAKMYNKKSIVLMLPKSYKYSTFDYIVAQKHDNPPNDKNIIQIPINLSFNEPKGILKKEDKSKKSLGIIIGGDNDIFNMNKDIIKEQLDFIFKNYPEHLKYITTSRRTPKEIEELIENYNFDYKLIYSKNPSINPIPDFIHICDEFFISIDSTSMLSEVRGNSDAKINIIKLNSSKENTKFHKLSDSVEKIDRKILFEEKLKDIKI